MAFGRSWRVAGGLGGGVVRGVLVVDVGGGGWGREGWV